MRTLITLLTLSLFLHASRAQDRDWSAELHYPISVGASFGASNQGLVGAGLAYRFAEFNSIGLGASLDMAWFATTLTNDSDPIQELKYRDFFLQPRLFAELPLSSNDKLKLRGGLGWTWSRSTGETFFNAEGRIEGLDYNSGLNLNVGLSYDLSPRWFLQVQYDLIFSSGDSPGRNIGLVKVGAGFRF